MASTTLQTNRTAALCSTVQADRVKWQCVHMSAFISNWLQTNMQRSITVSSCLSAEEEKCWRSPSPPALIISWSSVQHVVNLSPGSTTKVRRSHSNCICSSELQTFMLSTQKHLNSTLSSTKTNLDSRGRSVGVDEQQRRRPLAAEQEVKRVVVSHSSHVQQVTTKRRRGGARVQLHRQLRERRRNRPSINTLLHRWFRIYFKGQFVSKWK